MASTSSTILQPGRNCWRREHAERAAVLRNGEIYFAAFRQALLQARRQIFILGWDIHSKVELVRDPHGLPSSVPNTPEMPEMQEMKNAPTSLGPFLNFLAERNPKLDIRVLIWDFSVLLSMERDPNLLINLDWAPHPRIHFHLDDEHPLGASHHQKIVTVDGQVAFCGGLDLTHHRWDSSWHLPDDPRRTTPGGVRFAPFHDAMMIVDGQAAASLTQLCQSRWQRAQNETVELHVQTEHDVWPGIVQPWFTHAHVAIVRTAPTYKSHPEVREVEALYLDAIQAAKHSIFMENQYFTSPILCQALEERLQEEDGPDVMIILPRKIAGWLGNRVMEAKRGRILNRLIRADAHGRLRLLYPWVGANQGVMVHAKLMVVDDALLRVGSANLCNRSLGLDTECDLAMEAASADQKAGVVRLRNELLAEHCGLALHQVEEVFSANASPVKAVDILTDMGKDNEVPRGLGPLEPGNDNFSELVSEAEILDPERPLQIDRLMDSFVPEEESPHRGWLRTHWLSLLLGAALLVGLAVVWRFTPLSEYANREVLATAMNRMNLGWGIYPLIILGYVVGGLSLFPVTVLIGATTILLKPLPAMITAFVGCLISAAITYEVGRKLGRKRIERMAGGRLNRISQQLARHGMISVALVRNLPIAPFTLINLVAGASHIRFVDYLLGTLLGMGPGILAVTMFTDQLLAFLQAPRLSNVLLMVGAFIFLVLATKWLKRRFS